MNKGVLARSTMSSQQRFIRNEIDYDAVLLDIEGTTTPISFVKVRPRSKQVKIEAYLLRFICYNNCTPLRLYHFPNLPTPRAR